MDDGRFGELFEKHKYSLGQIERLTPQALTTISDSTNWPPMNLSTSTTFGTRVTSNFYTESTASYSKSKGITDTTKLERIKHSVIELQNLGLIETHKYDRAIAVCKLTNIGLELMEYIKPIN
ncbi:hypothetical protein [Metabacillus niabensis]|uniref:hypothetical protein n=1 Tax=Metabacillus niabensis TaxID=324854 RepID=UPI001CFB9E75|nr:hypothetical protein [Metabacillus niabensis]